MDHDQVARLARAHGDAFFVFDERRFTDNYAALRGAMAEHYPDLAIAYSYKTNYTPAICRRAHALGAYAEVVSEMEYALARRLGVDARRIIYNGPYKSTASLAEALTAGSIVNLDSRRDLDHLERIAAGNPGTPMTVGIRCNFPLAAGAYSRFGMDVEGPAFRQALDTVRRLPNVKLGGLHCHFPDRELETFAVRADRMLRLADAVFDEPPDFLNLGGGFFGGMPESLRRTYAKPVPGFQDYARALAAPFAARYRAGTRRPTLFIEPGTALVANTLAFFTRVVDVKQVRERRFATVAGSIFNISPSARSLRLPVTVISARADAGDAEARPHDVVGYTCVEGDVLTRDLSAALAPGDFLMYENVGSYSIVMKPPFILPNVPILRRSAETGAFDVIRRAEPMEYPFENFAFE